MLAERLPGLLPALAREQSLQVTAIPSVAGELTPTTDRLELDRVSVVERDADGEITPCLPPPRPVLPVGSGCRALRLRAPHLHRYLRVTGSPVWARPTGGRCCRTSDSHPGGSWRFNSLVTDRERVSLRAGRGARTGNGQHQLEAAAGAHPGGPGRDAS